MVTRRRRPFELALALLAAGWMAASNARASDQAISFETPFSVDPLAIESFDLSLSPTCGPHGCTLDAALTVVRVRDGASAELFAAGLDGAPRGNLTLTFTPAEATTPQLTFVLAEAVILAVESAVTADGRAAERVTIGFTGMAITRAEPE